MKNNEKTLNITITAVLCATVVALQLIGSFIRFGPVSVSLVLVPIVVGAALNGPLSGAILGLAFSVVVLLQPDTSVFYTMSVPGTIITVLAKGILCGLIAGIVYRVLYKKSKILAAFVAAIVCPVVNTGIFLVGCNLFFYDGIREWGIAQGATNMVVYIITTLVGLNFVFELIFNIVLSPAIVRIVDVCRKLISDKEKD